jgi:uncharacterized protein
MIARRAATGRASQLVGRALTVALLLLAAHAFAADLKFPTLTGRVVDNAGILSASTISELDEMLAQHEHTSGEQVVVVTLDSLQGHSIEDYGFQLGRAWGIGQKDKNNGAILIVAPHERKVRIEVGYGLEGQLTDATIRVIIESKITPQFRSGDFNAGVLAGTASILRALGDDAAAGIHREAEPEPVAQTSGDGAIVPPLVVLIFFVIVLLVMFRRGRYPYVMRHGGGYLGSGGFGGGSSGGGGFSGGGGSFGGGGASGGW